MAKIEGVVSGFIPTPEPKKKPKKKPKTHSMEYACMGCGHSERYSYNSKKVKGSFFSEYGDSIIGKADYEEQKKAGHEILCYECAKLFQWDMSSGFFTPGGMPQSVIEARKKMKDLKDGYYMISLINQSFGGEHTGRKIEIEMGDVFMPKRVSAKSGDGSREASKAFWSIDINIGSEVLTLFPWEFGTMSFVTLMQLRDAGEIIEQFVESSDMDGYFAPTPEVREMITQCFGNR